MAHEEERSEPCQVTNLKIYRSYKVLKWAMVFSPYSPVYGNSWKRVDFINVIGRLFPGDDKYSWPFVGDHEIDLKESRICGFNSWPVTAFRDERLPRIFYHILW
jgi:hypothetical protein